MNAMRPRAFITGGKRGIGRGTALAFAGRGWDVVVNDLAEDSDVHDTLDAIRQNGCRAAFVPGDIADLARTADLVEAAWCAFGGIEALVNNAGISVARRGDMMEVTPESFDRLISVNLRGPFFLTQEIARRWLAEAGIGVFEIRPGIIRTDMTRVAAERYDRLIADGISPIRRWGEPADIGGVAVTLAEGKFHFSTGEVVHVDGGLHISRL